MLPNIKEGVIVSDKYTSPIVKELRIGIIVVSDGNNQEKYKQFSKNLECYAKQHGYIFRIVDPKSYLNCSYLTNFFFQKHCAVHHYMLSTLNLNWLLVLDGDIFVVNSSKLIEEFIPKNENIHVVHYERFYTGEVVAGAYLIKNHPWSHNYLSAWVNFYSKLPKTGYHNHDNGALHMIFLQAIGTSDATQAKCYAAYAQAFNERNYYKYIRCFRCAIGGQRIFPHIQLLRRGHGFCRDFAVPFTSDFLLHGYKSNLNQFFHNSTQCTNDWFTNIRSHLYVSNLTVAREMTIKKDQYALDKYSVCLGIADITDCWPNCDQEITGEKLMKYTSALCHQ